MYAVRTARAIITTFAATFLLVLGCSSPASLPPGVTCSSDADCSGGLSCLQLAVFAADGGCSTEGTACSKACTTDADCASLGQKYKCFDGCSGAKSCGQTP